MAQLKGCAKFCLGVVKMPLKAKKPCKHPGCPNLCVDGYCDEHRPKRYNPEYEARRGSAAARGYTSRWRKASKAFLRAHPICLKCFNSTGEIVPATEVDHIVPHKGDQKLFWDTDNWQALCHNCHSAKTAREDGGFGNRRGGE